MVLHAILNMWHLKPPTIRMKASHNSYYPTVRMKASHDSYYPIIRMKASHNSCVGNYRVPRISKIPLILFWTSVARGRPGRTARTDGPTNGPARSNQPRDNVTPLYVSWEQYSSGECRTHLWTRGSSVASGSLRPFGPVSIDCGRI